MLRDICFKFLVALQAPSITIHFRLHLFVGIAGVHGMA